MTATCSGAASGPIRPLQHSLPANLLQQTNTISQFLLNFDLRIWLTARCFSRYECISYSSSYQISPSLDTLLCRSRLVFSLGESSRACFFSSVPKCSVACVTRRHIKLFFKQLPGHLQAPAPFPIKPSNFGCTHSRFALIVTRQNPQLTQVRVSNSEIPSCAAKSNVIQRFQHTVAFSRGSGFGRLMHHQRVVWSIPTLFASSSLCFPAVPISPDKTETRARKRNAWSPGNLPSSIFASSSLAAAFGWCWYRLLQLPHVLVTAQMARDQTLHPTVSMALFGLYLLAVSAVEVSLGTTLPSRALDVDDMTPHHSSAELFCLTPQGRTQQANHSTNLQLFPEFPTLVFHSGDQHASLAPQECFDHEYSRKRMIPRTSQSSHEMR